MSTRFLAVLAVSVLWGASAHGDVLVKPGYDLFTTDSAAYTLPGVGTVQFEGLPLGQFDFGSGPEDVGDTDTIVQRLEPADVTGSTLPATALNIDIELVALQLKSVSPVQVGDGPAEFLFVTLHEQHSSPGMMDITFNSEPANGVHGTYSSLLDVHFDIRAGSVDGPIVKEDDHVTLNASNTSWGHEAPPGAIRILGINFQLNGTDTSNDFWTIGPVVHDASGAGHHTVVPVPEASQVIAFAMLAIVAGGERCCRYLRGTKRAASDTDIAAGHR